MLERAIAARPAHLLILCVCGQPAELARALFRASSNGEQWAEHRARWVPAIAVVWPAELIPRVLGYIDAQGWPPQFTADDEIIGRAIRGLGAPALASVPSLVEHPAELESIVRRRSDAGKSRATACRPDPDCDLLGIDWTLGPA